MRAAHRMGGSHRVGPSREGEVFIPERLLRIHRQVRAEVAGKKLEHRCIRPTRIIFGFWHFFGISLAFLWHLAQPPPLNPSSPPPPHRSTKPGTSPRLGATSTPCSKRRSGHPQNRSRRRAGTAKTTPPPAPSRARACTWAAPTPPGRMPSASFHPRARARVNTSNGSVACVCPSRRWLT